MSTKLFRFISIVLILLLSFVALSADDQGWINNSMTLKLGEKSNISFKLTNEIRYHELTYMNPFLHNWQGGFVFKLKNNFYLAAAYKRENEQKTDFILFENRFTIEGGWKIKLTEKLSFDVRFRNEIRRFDKELSENHLRFRMRFRVKGSQKIGEITFKPFIGIEPFADNKVNEVFRYRFYLGTGVALTEHVGWVVNYIKQGTKDKESLDVINTGLELQF